MDSDQALDPLTLRPAAIARAMAASFVFSLCYLLFYVALLPHPLFDEPYSTILESSDGSLLSARIAKDEQWRFPEGQTVPHKFMVAISAYEDKRFWDHIGVDPASILRAVGQNLSAQDVESGASTITMQVIRMMRKNPPRTLGEKLIEVFLSLRLESSHTKEEIIALYASHAPYGGNVVGIEAASFRLFGRAPQNLSWAETCLLAVLPNSPGLIHVSRNRELLKNKRDRLLQRLIEQGVLDPEEFEASKLEPIPLVPKDLPNIASLYTNRMEDGTRIRSSLDTEIQKNLEKVVDRHYVSLSGNGIYNIAVLVLKQSDLSKVAYIANTPELLFAKNRTELGGANDMIVARRSTGSLLKPFLYAAMLDSGDLIPSQLVSDIPTRYGAYSPENNIAGYAGAVPADEALYRSLNIPAARELHKYGLDRFYALLKDLGMTTLFRPVQEYGLPLILGGAEGTLEELTTMYGTMGQVALGQKATLADGSPYPISRSSVYACLEALTNLGRPDEEANWQNFNSSRKVSWKTGTSFGYRDAWAIGLDGEWVVGVWVGNANGGARPDLKGAVAAGPLLFDVFSSLSPGPWFSKPDEGFSEVSICTESGFLAGPNCAKVRTVSIPQGKSEPASCPYCQLLHLDPESLKLADPAKISPFEMIHQKTFVLPPNIELWYKSHHPEYRGMPPSSYGFGKSQISIINPEMGSSLYIPVELDGALGKLVAQAADNDRSAVLFWHLDDDYVATTQSPHTLELRPSLGKHSLTVVDSRGQSNTVRFTVLSK